jgi:hypothetical protein
VLGGVRDREDLVAQAQDAPGEGVVEVNPDLVALDVLDDARGFDPVGGGEGDQAAGLGHGVRELGLGQPMQIILAPLPEELVAVGKALDLRARGQTQEAVLGAGVRVPSPRVSSSGDSPKVESASVPSPR